MSNWANKGKQDAQAIPVSNGLTVVSNRGSDPIVAFYNYKAPKNPSERARVLEKGTLIAGTYAGNYKKMDTFSNKEVTNHKVRTEQGIVALSPATQLDRDLSDIKEGARVEITYLGKEPFKDKTGRTLSAHRFHIAAEK
jgi:hypothetical protein